MSQIIINKTSLKKVFIKLQIFGQYFSTEYWYLRKARKEFESKIDLKFTDWENQLSVNSFEGKVLLDGMWDNPNYWIRVNFFVSALKINKDLIYGLLGKYRKSEVSRTFKNFKINQLIDYNKLIHNDSFSSKKASDLLKATSKSNDILNWKLPYDFPPSWVYDAILKKQRRGEVNIADPNLHRYISEAISSIYAAEKIFKSNKFSLVLMSHNINYSYGSIVWLAIKYNIPVVILVGDMGALKFYKNLNKKDIFYSNNCLNLKQMTSISNKSRDRIRAIGKSYLNTRLNGKTTDLGSFLNYQKRDKKISRSEILSSFGWQDEKPIIVVYASNWFDYPHHCQMNNFRDFKDWIEFTILSAKNNKDVNWIFKQHPVDDWYGIINELSIENMLPSNSKNISLADPKWNGKSLMEITDAAVTYHGTIGIELTSIGKPVLVADVGWYGNIGFVQVARSRNEYQKMLNSKWWVEMNMIDAQKLALEFAGWYFSLPDWQSNVVWPDDSQQSKIYDTADSFFNEYNKIYEKELELIYQWYKDSNSYFYHTFKIKDSLSH